MAYSESNPPQLISKAVSDDGQIWQYLSEDGATDVDDDGYITNAKELGMKQYDTVLVVDTNASPPITTRHTVVTINADGSADLSNSDGTNSD